MKVGVILPQGWTGEYDGWEPAAAWNRTVEVARAAERIGFESIWLFDHFHTVPRPTDELTFESFTALSALAALTERVRIGHIVICNGYRNPALAAKMASTLDDLRRAIRARHRGGMEARRVAGLRVRLPNHPRAAGGAG